MDILNKFVRRYTSISAVIDMLRRKEIALLDPQNWDDRNDRYFMNLYKEERNIKGLYRLCASMASETYHHWRVFTGPADGACVELKRGPLEKALSSKKELRLGEVEYLLFKDLEKQFPTTFARAYSRVGNHASTFFFSALLNFLMTRSRLSLEM
jgi:hypothetical protein